MSATTSCCLTTKSSAVLHSILIGLHAAFGCVAFLSGAVAISRARLLVVFVWSLVGTIAFLMAALAEEWGGLNASERILFSALALLGVYSSFEQVRPGANGPAGSVSERGPTSTTSAST